MSDNREDYREPTYGAKTTSKDDAFEMIDLCREMLQRLKEKHSETEVFSKKPQ